jgi:glycerate kinase
MAALAAPDKFRGSLRASAAALALCKGAGRAGRECRSLPLADGGEGTLDALGGPNRSTVVHGPDGARIEAEWRLEDGLAVVESAVASGLALAGGAERNDPVRASTRGTGELIGAALEAGAERVLVGVGGSACTDGGLGALEALGWEPFAVPVEVACDVRITFLDAAPLFGPQKGASPVQVAELARRLAFLADRYRRELGVDVEALPSSGAAGGLAGGLAALGAKLVPGFELVASATGLEEALADSDLVLTGEGKLDATSFEGKVVGSLLARCADMGLPALVVAGEVEAQPPGVNAVSLVERFGRKRAWSDTAACIADAVAESLSGDF